MSVIDQKEYLKRYLSLGDEKEKNKKRKKRAKAIQNRVKIIDDDIDLPRNVNEDEMREFLTAEDAPQIVGIVDDRPLHMRIDDYRKSDKWKLVGSDDDLKEVNDSKTKASYSKQSDSDASPPRKTKKSARTDDRSPLRFDFKKEKKDRRHSDSDPSPPRKNRRRSSSDPSPPRRNRRKSSSDPSPPRKNKKNLNESPTRKTRKQSDSDTSPPRRSRKQQIDNGPSKKTRKQSDSDASPPRKSRKEVDSSPPRKSRRVSPDLSPPRTTRKQLDSDTSPPRRSRKQQIHNSPPRRTRKQSDSDGSPSRKSRKEADGSTPRKSRKEVDSSPPRKSRRASPNLSPPRKNVKNSNSEPKVRKSRWGSASKSPPRKSRNLESDSRRSRSHETSNKMTKTLDGKTAGIQFAGDLKKETAALKKREDDMFKNMSTEISGKNAAPILRDRKTGKKRDLEKEAMEEMEKLKVLNERKEKYDKWGKGLKQVEDNKQKIEQDLYEMTKPLARYADDEDLEKYLKEQEREGDPMLQYIRKKKRKEAVASGKPIDTKPQYEGEFMPNRYGIPPGHRWDGVDRSNGYEKQWFKVQNDKKAVQEDIYKWSTEDM